MSEGWCREPRNICCNRMKMASEDARGGRCCGENLGWLRIIILEAIQISHERLQPFFILMTVNISSLLFVWNKINLISIYFKWLLSFLSFLSHPRVWETNTWCKEEPWVAARRGPWWGLVALVCDLCPYCRCTTGPSFQRSLLSPQLWACMWCLTNTTYGFQSHLEDVQLWNL